MKVKVLSLIDWVMIACVLFLSVVGIMFIYSSAIDQYGNLTKDEYLKQIIWVVIGLGLLLFAAFFDYRNFEKVAVYLFGLFIILLIVTRFIGKQVNGAKSWIGIGRFGIQPAELGKVVYILFLGWFFHKTEELKERRRFVLGVVIMLVTMLPILAQPDLGTASVYIPIFFFMAFAASVPLRYIIWALAFGVLTVVIAILPVWQSSKITNNTYAIVTMLTDRKFKALLIMGLAAISLVGFFGMLFYRHNRYYHWITYGSTILLFSMLASVVVAKALKPYQFMRLIIFLKPSAYRQSDGWNLIQSINAVGAGGFKGAGFLQGRQSHLQFLPEHNTDFIFSIIAEEAGFVGGMFVFALYFALMMRIIMIIRRTTNHFGYYVASGILGLFFFHFTVNVGMVMGIMPITGIPLLFLSYGGSSMWTAMFSVGLLMSINYRHFSFMNQEAVID